MEPAAFAATILTRDTATAADFYREHFGMEETSNTGWFISMRRADQPWEVCVLDRTHAAVPPDANPEVGGIILAFVTEDATADAARFEARGIPIAVPMKDEPWGQRHFYIRDPTGTLIDVVEFITPDPEWLRANGFDAEATP